MGNKARIILFFMTALLMGTFFFGCTSVPQTPVEDTSAQLDWSFEIEGAGSVTSLKLDDVKDEKLTKVSASGEGAGGQISSRFYQGIKLNELLAKWGVTDFTSVTVYTSDGKEQTYSKESALNDGTIIAWIQNSKPLHHIDNNFDPEDFRPVHFVESNSKERKQVLKCITKITITK